MLPDRKRVPHVSRLSYRVIIRHTRYQILGGYSTKSGNKVGGAEGGI